MQNYENEQLDNRSWLWTTALFLPLHAPADFLLARLRRKRREVAELSLFSAFPTASPFTAVLGHSGIQFVLLLVALAHGIRGSVALVRFTTPAEAKFSSFRFATMQFRNGSQPDQAMAIMGHQHRRDMEPEMGSGVDMGSTPTPGEPRDLTTRTLAMRGTDAAHGAIALSCGDGRKRRFDGGVRNGRNG